MGSHPAPPGILPSYVRRSGIKTTGEVILAGATIDGQLHCRGGRFANPGGWALTANGMRVNLRGPLATGRDARWADQLRHARIGPLFDDERTWSEAELKLDGLIYESLDPLTPAEDRLRWLERQERYWPSSYEQLIATYRAAGRNRDARKVAMAKQERHRAELRGSAKCWNWFLGRAVGHGYQPWRALAGLVVVFLVGWFVFAGRSWPAR